MVKGETFREIAYWNGDTSIHITSQKQIDDLKTLLNEIEIINNPPNEQNIIKDRFSDLDIGDDP